MFNRLIKAGIVMLSSALVISTTPITVTTSQATVTVEEETVIAGAGALVEDYVHDEKVRSAVRQLLEIEPETTTQEPTTEETTTEEPTEPAPVTTYIVSIAEKYVNVRSTPSASGSENIIGKMYPGAVGVVSSTELMPDGYWYLMQSGSVTGYVKADFFIIGEEADAYMAANARNIGTVVGTELLNVRSGPSTAYDVIAQLGQGDQYAIAGVENDFYLIQLDESFSGYVYAGYVTVTSTYKTAITLDEERIAIEKAAEEEAARLAAIEAERLAEEEASRLAAEAAERERLANTVVGISAYYIGSGNKYAGDVVDITELSVVGNYGDGSVKPLMGWACAQVGAPLAEGENVFVVSYESFSASFSVLAATPTTEPTTPAPTEPQTEPSSDAPSSEQEATAPPTETTVQPAAQTFTCCGLLAAYAGTVKYEGQTVSRSEIEVCGAFSNYIDYAYNAYVYDWECAQLDMPLPHGDTVFHITYQGQSYDLVINAYAAPTDDSLRSQIVSYAVQFLGNPYVYGGNSLVDGTDCSGFVKLVYQHFGYTLYRSSAQQVNNGRIISYSEMQPGDLLFYTNSNGVIGHVAMYIGEGKIIHAANETLGIIISNVTYRTPAYVTTIVG
ncbi:MAG: C40 family peptidase [Lachnospiraceae bacterium]|nr:C40 family peptidase [Lachnospiraceae bacterium]